MLSELMSQLKALARDSDVEAMTALLEQWPVHDDEWAMCVEMRMRAPSSSKEQRARLRALRDQDRIECPQDVLGDIARLDAELAAKRREQAALAAVPVDPSVLALPGLEVELAAVSVRIESTVVPAAQAPWIAATRTLLARVREENLRKQSVLKRQFDALREDRRIAAQLSFAEFLGEQRRQFLCLGNVASASEWALLQQLAPQPLCAELHWFHSVMGGLQGECGATGLHLSLPNAAQLLAAHHSDRPWACYLPGINLLDMAVWDWGGDRPELTLAGGLPLAVHDAASSFTCIGVLSDDFLEERGYIIALDSQHFGLWSWHQDEAFVAPDMRQIRAFGLLELLLKVLDACAELHLVVEAEACGISVSELCERVNQPDI